MACMAGTPVEGDTLARKTACVAKAVLVNKDQMNDPLDVMRCVGGRELAAMAGATLAARLKNIPVMLDGYVSTAAVAPLAAFKANALDHCKIGHTSKEIGHKILCEKLGQDPLLHMGMALGEGSGGVLAVGLCRAAIACHTGMATFEQASVDTAQSS